MKTQIPSSSLQHPSSAVSIWRSQYALVIALVSLGIASSARAQSGSEDTTLFGTFGQLNAGVTYQNGLAVNPNACVPTATVNGLAYLYNEYGASTLSYAPSYTSVNNLAQAMGTSDNNYYQYYTAANQLVYTSKNVRNATTDAAATALGATQIAFRQDIGGTGTYPMFNGLQSYLSAGGLNPSPNIKISGVVGGATPAGWLNGPLNPGMSVANATPTAQYLATQLNAHNAVELTLEWGVTDDNTVNGKWTSQGGHEVLLGSLSLSGATGSLIYSDPEATATSAGGMSGTLTLGADGYLYVSGFTQTLLDENPPDLQDALPGAPAPTQFARIDDVMVEAVPEPATFGILGALGGLLLTAGRFAPKSRRDS